MIQFKDSRVIIIGVLVVIGIFLALGAVFYFTNQYFKMKVEEGVNAMFLPAELRHALFVAGTQGETKVRTASFPGYREVARFPSGAISFSHTKNIFVWVRHDTGANYQILEGDRVIAESVLPISSTSISADGTQVVFSVSPELRGVSATTTIALNQSLAVLPKEAQLLQVSTAITAPGMFSFVYPLGPGTTPVFLEGMHLLYATFGGMVETNLENRKESVLTFPQLLPVMRTPLTVSPDQTTVAWFDGNKKTVEVYALTEKNMAHLGSVSVAPPYSFALGDEGVYEIRVTAKGSEVWKHSFDGKINKSIYTLPSFMGINRLLF